MLNYHHFHRPHIDFPNRELVEIFLFQILKGLAFGLINIYVPIYLYTNGVPLVTIMALFTARSFLHVLAAQLLVRSVLFRVGVKHLFALAMLLYMGSFFAIQQGIGVWHLAAWVGFSAIANAFYAIAHHSYLTLTIDEKKAGSEIALMTISILLFGVLTPVVGSLAIILFGFSNMFAVGGFFAVLSIVPLFFSPELNISQQIKLPGMSHLKNFWKEKRPLALSAVGNGFDGSSDPLWNSLYIFKILGGIKSVGILTSVVTLIQVLTNYISGKRADKNQKSFELGLKGSIAARLLTFAAFHPSIVVMSETMNSIIHPLFGTAYRVSFYKEMKSAYALSYIVAHEVIWHLANTFALIVITVAVYFVGWYAFLVTGIFMVIGKMIVLRQRVGI